MRADSLVWGVVALATLGCGPAPPSDEAAELNCLALTGGFEEADLDDIETQCRGSGDTACDREDWIQADAARCVAAGGQWSADLRDRLTAPLGVALYEPHTQWGVRDPGDIAGCTFSVAAASGELLGSACP